MDFAIILTLYKQYLGEQSGQRIFSLYITFKVDMPQAH